ncbi:MAG: hypothetical protein Q8N73_01820 [bacterium]|nr:hypothetical protein [bacterium]
MTKKTRTVLFSICVFLFLVSASAVVFYSQGYRFDFEKKKITQAGAFYFKVLPRSAQIYLNGQLKKETDFIFGSALIENLLPKTYNIQIKKEGYISWEKTLEIKEKQVTEAKNIVLIPESLGFTVLSKEVKDFFFSPDAKKIILEEIRENGWQINLYDLKNNVKSYLIGEKDIAKGEESKVDFLSLKFSPDSKGILLKVGLKDYNPPSTLLPSTGSSEEKYFILDLEKTPPDLISLSFLGTDIQDISFNPQVPQKIFFTKSVEEDKSSSSSFAAARVFEEKTEKNKIAQTDLFEADWGTKEISQAILSNLIAYEVSGGNIFLISDEGFLFRTDFSGKRQEQLSFSPFPIKKEVDYQLLVNFPKILLKEDDNLYFFDQALENFKKLSASANSFSFSPDLKKIVYFNNYEIWILFLEEKFDQPQKKVGEEIFLTRFSEKIGEVFWLTSHYLIFNAGNKLKIAEIDDRDKINIVDLSPHQISGSEELVEFKDPKIFWNQNNKKLYLFSEKNLYTSGERLVP